MVIAMTRSTMVAFYKSFCLPILVLMSLSGCSLLEVKLDSQVTPLTQQELNTRLHTREYALQFFTQVEQTADTLKSGYPATDTLHQSYILLWKINAEEGLARAAYQVSSTAALIDSWVFTQQMTDYFSQGPGREQFESTLASDASQALLTQVEQLASALLKNSSYKSSQQFVREFATQHPFTDLKFNPTPAYRAWLKANDINEDEAITTLGTMPEALGDVSDRLSLISEQTPKIMSWKAELIALNSSISGEDLSQTLASMKATSEAFQDFVKNNPEYMKNLAEQMAIELQPLVADIDQKTSRQMSKLDEQRAALEAMVARERVELFAMIEREREALNKMVTQERVSFTQDMDKLSQDVVALAMDKLVELIKSVIIYFVLFIAVIFFAPLGLGYALGKRAQRKSN
ncbi:TPA: chemotaxis protein [Vibrio vulnificus]|nr:chemotaxis protein [Vibrio vulnificus]